MKSMKSLDAKPRPSDNFLTGSYIYLQQTSHFLHRSEYGQLFYFKFT